jgi:hypothetical protein
MSRNYAARRQDEHRKGAMELGGSHLTTRARAIALAPLELYDDTPIHDTMEGVQFPMIDVLTRVPSNGHGQLARESGRLTRRSKDSSTSGESGSSRCPRALAAFRDRAMPPQSIRFVFSHLDRTIVARAPPASGRSFDVREKGLQQRTSRFLSPGSVIRIRLPAQRHVGAVEG